MNGEDIFMIKVRRCLRCGGLLTSPDSIKDGYGRSCLRKMRREAIEREQQRNQISLFDMEDNDGDDEDT